MGRTLNSLSIGAVALVLGVLPAAPASAQSRGLVVRDGTLGGGPPGVIVPPGPDDLGQADYLIRADLGEQRGGNLFHSFARFSIGSGERATFTDQGAANPGAIDNVVSRVTGGNPSQIDGTLHSTIPGADLWLLNPSGVVFGEGAQLDVPGSFHASTGDYVGFEGSLERFYGDPSRPSVLSTVPPEAFGFLGAHPAKAISVSGATLAVPEGETLELVGGDISLTAANLSAPAGAVSIRGGQIVLEEGSEVFAESTGDRAGGTIEVVASESLLVDDSLLSVSTHSAGNAGTIHVQGPLVTFQNGPGLPLNPPPFVTEVGASAETFGTGAGGTIQIDAGALTLRNGVIVSAGAGAGATGDAGTIRISGGSVHVSASSFIGAAAYGSAGNAGAILVDLTDKLTVDGTSGKNLPPYAFLSTAAGTAATTAGAPGRIEIEARAVEILNGGVIASQCTNCSAAGAAIRIVAEDVVVSGANLQTESHIGVYTRGSGNAGELWIEAGSLDLRDGGSLRAGTGADGDAGQIVIDVGSVSVTGSSPFGGSAIFAPANPGATGNAGEIWIRADSLLLASPDDQLLAQIDASSFGPGKGGTIDIDVGDVVIAPGGIIVAAAGLGSSGEAGTILIHADTLHVGPHPDFPQPPGGAPIPGSWISASSFGPGKGGTIDVEAAESILVTYEGGPPFDLQEFLLGQAFGLASSLSGIFSAAVGEGAGGDIRLRAPDITIIEGGIVASSSVGGGAGGAVELRGERIRVLNGAFVDSTSVPNSLAFTFGDAAGSVTLTASESIEVAGRRRVTRQNVEVDDWSRVSSASVASGPPGTVTLRAPRVLIDGGAVATTALLGPFGRDAESGGAIEIEAGQLIVRAGGRIDASSFASGPGGDIAVTARESILVEGEGSGIASRSGGAGPGGSVSLSAPRIEVGGGGEVEARSERGLAEVREIFNSVQTAEPVEATGDAGSVTLAAGKVLLTGGTIATNAEAADGGDVTIQAKQLVHLDAGVITAAVRDGAGGNIAIDPEVVILEHGSRIVADAGTGSGGNIQITADNYFAFPGSLVDASSDLGIDGIVEVHTPDVDLAGTLTALPASYLDAASLMRERCAARRSGERAGSFSVRGNGGIPPEPDGWLPATVSFEGAPGLAPTAMRAAVLGGVPLFALGSCR